MSRSYFYLNRNTGEYSGEREIAGMSYEQRFKVRFLMENDCPPDCDIVEIDKTQPNTKGTIERAFDLAKSGSCNSIQQIADKLYKQGCLDAHEHLSGAGIRQQLHVLIKAC